MEDENTVEWKSGQTGFWQVSGCLAGAARYVAPAGYRRDIRIKSEMYKQQTVTVAGVANVLDDENAFRRLDGNCLSAACRRRSIGGTI